MAEGLYLSYKIPDIVVAIILLASVFVGNVSGGGGNVVNAEFFDGK